jgi:uncharacterized protein (TIGR03067 family)
MKTAFATSLTAVLILFLCCPSIAQETKPETPSPLAQELKALSGVWETESIVNDGETQEQRLRVTIGDKRFAVQIGEATLAFKMTIDPTCTPKLIDLSYDAEAENPLPEDFLAEGIYELDKDALRICLTPPQGIRERPQKFESPANSGRILITLRRISQ